MKLTKFVGFGLLILAIVTYCSPTHIMLFHLRHILDHKLSMSRQYAELQQYLKQSVYKPPNLGIDWTIGGEFPSLVRIIMRDNRQCNGVILSPTAIITSSMCGIKDNIRYIKSGNLRWSRDDNVELAISMDITRLSSIQGCLGIATQAVDSLVIISLSEPFDFRVPINVI